MVFSGTATRYLAEKICQSLGCPLGQLQITKFSDGEFAVSYEESIRGRDIFLVQSTFPNSDNLMELLLMIDAAKRASARTINAVIPYFGWARQDRKDKPRVSIGAKLIADLLSVAGVNRVITMDLHADQIQGFFDVPVDHLYASGVIMPYLKSLQLEDLVIASPDVGGSKRANTYAKFFGCPLVLCNKTRARANVVATMQIIGDVEGKNVVLIDDMVDYQGCRPDEAGRSQDRTCLCLTLRDERPCQRPRTGVGPGGNHLYGLYPLYPALRQGETALCSRHVCRGHPSCHRQQEHQRPVYCINRSETFKIHRRTGSYPHSFHGLSVRHLLYKR